MVIFGFCHATYSVAASAKTSHSQPAPNPTFTGSYHLFGSISVACHSSLTRAGGRVDGCASTSTTLHGTEICCARTSQIVVPLRFSAVS